jgi:hydroxyacylglutathione hydrolase
LPVIVDAVPCLDDNYAWLVRAPDGAVAVCDPGEAAPAIAALEKAGGRLDLILLTHHHGDHVNGVAAVKQRFPGAKVVGARADAHRLPPLDLVVEPGGTVRLGSAEAAVIDTPGHTVGHVAYHFPVGGVLLCGDTLFSLGCGRFLEGTPAQMFGALAALKALPDATLVCCGHEYTASNARFALSVDPDNTALRTRADRVQVQRAGGLPTVPTTIAEERAANPFLRAPDAAALGRLRAAKDAFR